MRLLIPLSALVLAVLLPVAGTPASSTPTRVQPTVNPAAPGPTRFSSRYTSLARCGSGMTKKEEREAAANGSDIPTRCKGNGGYDVYIYYSACASIFTLVRGEESIALTTQPGDWKQKTVEWRFANAKPFAVIMRVYDYTGDDLCTSNAKMTGSSLIVKGLKGYNIDEKVDANSPNANVKARALADKAYANTKP